MRMRGAVILLMSLGCTGGMIGGTGGGQAGGDASGGGSGGGTTGTGGGSGGSGGGSSGGSGGITSPDLPCEVATVVQTHCQSCHGATLMNGAPIRLVTRDHLLAPSDIEPSLTIAERSVFRMRAPLPSRMPPAPHAAVNTDDIDAFEGWITSGMPEQSCPSGTGGGSATGGGGDSGGGSGGGATGGGASGGGAGGGSGGAPFVADPPEVYAAKVKSVLVGLPLTDSELGAVKANPGQLGTLVDSWMLLPEYQAKMLRFFQLAFQQTQINSTNFVDMLGNANLNIGPSPAIVQNLQESFARTMLSVIARNQPFTRSMTTNTYAMTTALQAFYALRDVYQLDNRTGTAGIHDEFRTSHPGLNIVVSASSGPIPLSQSLDPASPNYMHWYDPNVMTACGVDPLVAPARANTLFQVLLGARSQLCSGRFTGQFSATDFSDWKMVTVRKPRAGEKRTDFYDLPTFRNAAQNELLLAKGHTGFFTTPAFFANWGTNDSNQMRVTINQIFIVATGTQVDGTDTFVPSRTPGMDTVHANTSACVYCHQTLDPSRSILAANYSWNYGVQTDTAFSGQNGLFAYRGVEATVNTVQELGVQLANHPLFGPGWTQKLCYWVNSIGCDVNDPEFTRLATLFKTSNWSWNTLVKAVVTSPITTHATSTVTATKKGIAIAVARKDHLCAQWSSRLGIPDVCGLDVTHPSPLPAAGRRIIPGLPSDGYSRGNTTPALPNAPTLFYRSGLENLCSNLAAVVVEPANPTPGAKRWLAAQSATAIAEFVSIVAGLPPSDPRAAVLSAQLNQHFNDAKATSGVTPALALRSTFIVACTSATAASIGL